MKNNTMDYFEFNFNTFVSIFVFYMFYRVYLFCNIDRCTTFKSNIILCLLIIGIYAANMVISGRYARNGLSIVATVIVPFGIYAYITNSKYISTKVIWGISLVSFMSIALYCIFLMLTKVKGRKKTVIKIKARSAYVGIRTVFSLACLSIIITVFFKLFFLGGLVTTQYEISSIWTDEYAFANNVEILRQLSEEKWKKLSVDEKLNVGQVVVNIESRYLGLDNKLMLKASNLGTGELGYYDEINHVIQIDIEHLEKSHPKEVVKTLAHECFHSAQHMYYRIWSNLEPTQKQLYFFNDVENYAQDIENYKNAKEGYEKYYSQSLEQAARMYAVSSCEQIFLKLEEGKDFND